MKATLIKLVAVGRVNSRWQFNLSEDAEHYYDGLLPIGEFSAGQVIDASQIRLIRAFSLSSVVISSTEASMQVATVTPVQTAPNITLEEFNSLLVSAL